VRNPNHQIKDLIPKIKISADIILKDGVVFIAQYGAEKNNALSIHQPDFYRTLVSWFEMLWAAN
jgi:hypothetical protein